MPMIRLSRIASIECNHAEQTIQGGALARNSRWLTNSFLIRFLVACLAQRHRPRSGLAAILWPAEDLAAKLRLTLGMKVPV